MDNFYLVWRQDTKEVSFKHPTYEQAEHEATRLAKKHPGKRFYILIPNAVRHVVPEIPASALVAIKELLDLPPEVITQLSKKLQKEIENAKNI